MEGASCVPLCSCEKWQCSPRCSPAVVGQTVGYWLDGAVPGCGQKLGALVPCILLRLRLCLWWPRPRGRLLLQGQRHKMPAFVKLICSIVAACSTKHICSRMRVCRKTTFWKWVLTLFRVTGRALGKRHTFDTHTHVWTLFCACFFGVLCPAHRDSLDAKFRGPTSTRRATRCGRCFGAVGPARRSAWPAENGLWMALGVACSSSAISHRLLLVSWFHGGFGGGVQGGGSPWFCVARQASCSSVAT